ncbi:MAG: alkaline phosphatase family protein [Lentisphaerae bacterium]|jgi:hypothetical protein|nr:alkaline phosphatase family protein [Lentisphaerota bacterium]MBT4822916.1 alkaline phosphatase family protein [Lentisphaerota bacterium]MBT5609765.1 alkaline phosphatase family protein [Lentisphaerota bacterium]MBT7061407.1 alkaline phosphatase family protein [Lentisphaerota bacterium]MBT7845097.1 alkaline phosphatase family protein [Lentisphaerota bacterium]
MPTASRILVVQVAGLGFDTAAKLPQEELQFAPVKTVFPALTCPFQASFRTAAPPATHGMIANGLYGRDLRKVMFWEQSSGLVQGERIWDQYRQMDKRVGMLFWQQSLGETVDVVLSPAPIHLHSGGMVQDCYCQPAWLYGKLKKQIGRPFKLRHYWGPLASAKAGDWIADATCRVLTDERLALDLCFTYLPTLDYAFQRHGPDAVKSQAASACLTSQLARLLQAAENAGWDLLVVGDYAIGPAADGGAIFPNRLLAKEGLLETRNVKGKRYPDLHASRAFAMVDHEIAHVYASDVDAATRAETLFAAVPGVADVLTTARHDEFGVAHANTGELILIGEPGCWFAYPWWTDRRDAPDYATHIDIHNKPGFDPCELSWSWWPPGVSLDTKRVKGTHGRTGPGRDVSWASTMPMPFDEQPTTVTDVAACLRRILEGA